ncbi:MAG TPA: tetratricopeptide repeat protein [Candidatus Limnocylindria bacterium]|jgi:tetratricopeptide (TPR) repeat protein|nr:tetratricopeptide repeat protein [Candidatus Limnocylindria bacterium]
MSAASKTKAATDSDEDLKLRQVSFRRVRAAENKGLTALFIERCKIHLRRFPEHAAAWTRYGRALVEVACYRKARQAYQNAMRHCPADKLHVPYTQMGFLCEAMGRYADAERWHRKAAELKPEEATCLVYAGHVSFKAGALQKAEGYYRRAAECREGAFEEVWFNLGGVLLGQERYREARECYLKALTIDPKYRTARKRLKDVELLLKEFPN